MNRKTNAIFDKLYFPDKPNYEYVSEYFASKCSDDQKKISFYNCGDDIELNVEITNYLIRKQLLKTTRKLEHKRKDCSEKRRIVQEQWEDLRVKEESFRQNFIRFNQFVKENQEKKERAANKVVEQTQLKEERQQRILDLMNKCQDIMNVKAKMDKNISQYRIYEEFLKKVIEREDSMQSINDLLKRYEALIGARRELNEIQQRDMMKLEKAKSNLKSKTDAYLNVIGSLSNRLKVLNNKYENARRDCLKWETICKHVGAETATKVTDIVEIKECCKTMYLEICRRKKIHPIHESNVEKQLFTIKQALGEYEIINTNLRKMQEQMVKLSVKAKSSNTS